jgi:hypothetical protein
MPPPTSWAELRYGRLLPLAARRRSFASAYARVVSLVEWSSDARRRRVARSRIARWLCLTDGPAALLYRRCLESEAREEADTAWFMAHPEDLERAYHRAARPDCAAGATIWLTLHFGSPILAYVYVRRVWGIDAAIIGRTLDDQNPMPAAKQAFGRRKVAWVELVTGKPFLGVDAASIAHAREHLLRGGSLFAAIDVPGDVVRRSARIELFGEPVCIAGGIPRIAELARVPMRTLVATSRGGAIHLRSGAAIEARPGGSALAAVGAEIEAILRREPAEWWLWPYLPSLLAAVPGDGT